MKIKKSSLFLWIHALLFSNSQQSKLQSRVSASAGLTPSQYNPFLNQYMLPLKGVNTFASGVILLKDGGQAPGYDNGMHLGKLLTKTDNKARIAGWNEQPYYEKFYDRLDIIRGVDNVPGSVSFKLTGTEDYLCAENYPSNKVLWATEQAGFSPQQCSWDRFGHPSPSFADTYLCIRSFDNRWLQSDLAGSGEIILFGQVGEASSGTGPWWMNVGPGTESAPTPPSAGPVSLIGKGSTAGYLQDGSLPSNADELTFYQQKTGGYCRGPADFNWTSLYTAIIGQGEARCQATLESAKNDSYQSGLQNGNITGFMAGVAVGQQRGYQAGFENGQTEGNSTGYLAGFNAGKSAGVLEGFSQGLTQGRAEGKQQGIDEGKILGASQGYQTGFETGKLEGIEEGKTKCPKLPNGGNVVVRNYVEDGNNKTETTVTTPEKTVIVTEWDTYVPPPHIHHKIVEERWPDGRKNITYTQESDQWLWTNVTTISITPPSTDKTIFNHTVPNSFPEIHSVEHVHATPSGSTSDSSSVIIDPPRTTTTTDKTLPDGRPEHKVIIVDTSTGLTTTTTTTTHTTPDGVVHKDVITDVSGGCPTGIRQ